MDRAGGARGKSSGEGLDAWIEKEGYNTVT